MGCCQANPELQKTGSGKEIISEFEVEVRSKYDGGEDEGMMRLLAKLDEIWEQYDLDQDDVLNKQEGTDFLKACLQQFTGSEPTDENVESAFRSIDADGDGTLDRREVLMFLRTYADSV